MAQSFPDSTFHGFDFHEPSIEHARERARSAGVAHNTIFEVVNAKQYPGADYDLVAIFDALHDMGDPVGACAHIASTLTDNTKGRLCLSVSHNPLRLKHLRQQANQLALPRIQILLKSCFLKAILTRT